MRYCCKYLARRVENCSRDCVFAIWFQGLVPFGCCDRKKRNRKIHRPGCVYDVCYGIHVFLFHLCIVLSSPELNH